MTHLLVVAIAALIPLQEPLVIDPGLTQNIVETRHVQRMSRGVVDDRFKVVNCFRSDFNQF